MKPHVTIGNSPLLLAQPHGGTEVPDDIFNRLNDKGKALADADWHISQLYDGLVDDVTIVSTPIHRYVIDANRGPDDASLYPGQNTTGLCPLTTFDGVSIYLDGEAPDANEIQHRQQTYHQPYHDAIRDQLDCIHKKHGFAILYDCHSIRSLVPYLFEGQLPDFNIGTNNGLTCDAIVEAKVVSCCAEDEHFTHVVNGRFKGGWTTRHYGKPESGYHAIQMELAQLNYMQEVPPWTYGSEKLVILRERLRLILSSLLTISIPNQAN